jgi:AmpD protein
MPERRGAWREGWWRGAVRRPSPNQGPRPPGERISLVIVHSISLPPGVYGGDQVERFFLGRLNFDDHPYFDSLRALRVSAHFLIRRSGALLQFVSCDRRAWHAGRSVWRGRGDCNDWSIGIELEGLEGDAFDAVQYHALATLLDALTRRYPIAEVVGHEHVAPGRKGDPGAGFEWARLRRLFTTRRVRLPFAGLRRRGRG